MPRNSTRQTLAENVRLHRAKLNITQGLLAKRSKLSARLISIIESDARANVELETLERIAKGLGVTVVDLLTDSQEVSGERRKQAIRLAVKLLEEMADG